MFENVWLNCLEYLVERLLILKLVINKIYDDEKCVKYYRNLKSYFMNHEEVCGY